jgi:hypothetical protein
VIAAFEVQQTFPTKLRINFNFFFLKKKFGRKFWGLGAKPLVPM